MELIELVKLVELVVELVELVELAELVTKEVVEFCSTLLCCYLPVKQDESLPMHGKLKNF